MLKHIDFELAQKMLTELPVCTASETVGLEHAVGRVLSRSYTAKIPMPPFNRSPFDGYAFKGADTPGRLKIVGTVFAGDGKVPEIKSGEALHIFTGAPVPQSADCTIKFEDTEVDGDYVRVPRMSPGKNVIISGEDYPAGTDIAEAGKRISPAMAGVFASQGCGEVEVFRKPTAALIATGTELVKPGAERDTYSIYNSSSYVIKGLLENLGVNVRLIGPVPDEPELIAQCTREALSRCDMVITTGGASVGDKDFALGTAESCGAEILFWKLNMKPGGAILAANAGGRLLLSLSGNPAASIMSLLIVVQPYIRKLCGQSDTELKYVSLRIKDDVEKTSSAYRMLRGNTVIENGMLLFEEHSGRGNGNVSSFVGCNAIGIIPPTDSFIKSGDMINAVLLDADALL